MVTIVRLFLRIMGGLVVGATQFCAKSKRSMNYTPTVHMAKTVTVRRLSIYTMQWRPDLLSVSIMYHVRAGRRNGPVLDFSYMIWISQHTLDRFRFQFNDGFHCWQGCSQVQECLDIGEFCRHTTQGREIYPYTLLQRPGATGAVLHTASSLNSSSSPSSIFWMEWGSDSPFKT